MNVVVKELFGGDMTDDERRKSLNEIQVLSLLEHPNIISYFDSFVADASVMILGTDDQTEDDRGDSGDKMLMIVMEYANGGTLNDYLTIRKSPLEEEVCVYSINLNSFFHQCVIRFYLHLSILTLYILLASLHTYSSILLSYLTTYSLHSTCISPYLLSISYLHLSLLTLYILLSSLHTSPLYPTIHTLFFALYLTHT